MKTNFLDYNDPIELYETTFTHMYFSHGFTEKLSKSEKRKRHACLRMGYWCWKNILDRPLDIFIYLKRKVVK